MTKKYSDAVVAEAARQTGWSPDAIKDELSRGDNRTFVICDLISATLPEEPEVNPVLDEARERLAKKADAGKYSATAEGHRVGNFDTYYDTLVAIDLINKCNAWQAELDALRANAEPKPLDPHGPLWAHHVDGREPVRVDLDCVDYDGSIDIDLHHDVRIRDEFFATRFRKDGTNWSGEWTLRNRVQS